MWAALSGAASACRLVDTKKGIDMEDKTTRSAEEWAKIDASASPATVSAGPHSNGTSGGMTILRLFLLLSWVAYAWNMGQIPASGLNGFGKFVSLSFFVAAPALYFLPTIEGALRSQPNQTSIAIVNLLLGWTLVGWVVAMAWACKSQAAVPVAVAPRPTAHPIEPSPLGAAAPAASVADELSKLAALKDRGILSQDEFDAQKAKVLGQT